MACGIYSIYCLKNDKYYIGQSGNIERRWKEHIRLLNKNNHHNCYLQSAWNKYCINNFEFEILEICNKDILWKQELFYMEYFQTYNDKYGFNLDIVVGPNKRKISDITRKKFIQANRGENNPNFGRKHSPKTIEKIRQANLGKKLSKETKQKISLARKGEKNPLFGKTRSDEVKLKISQSNKGKNLGRKHNEITKKKISNANKGENNYMFGRNHSEESKRKISEAKRK